MRTLQEPPTRHERKVSSLRQRIRQPGLYLLVVSLLAPLGVADLARNPEHQMSARVYGVLVAGYQTVSPSLWGRCIQCRYAPSCSRYSTQAVDRFGLLQGLRLTHARLRRCQPTVPMGTLDPVPKRGAEEEPPASIPADNTPKKQGSNEA